MASSHVDGTTAGEDSSDEDMTLGEAVERHVHSMASIHVERTTAGEDSSDEDMTSGEAVERHTVDVDPHEERWSIVRFYDRKGWLSLVILKLSRSKQHWEMEKEPTRWLIAC